MSFDQLLIQHNKYPTTLFRTTNLPAVVGALLSNLMGREVRVDEEEGGAEEDKCDGDGALRLERRRRPGAERVNLRSRAKPDLERQDFSLFLLIFPFLELISKFAHRWSG